MCPSPRCSRRVVQACQASPSPAVPSAVAMTGHRERLAPAMTRPAASQAAAARRNRGRAATRSERASTRQTSLSAPAAAIARTRHSVSGATTSQHPGTARATIPGWKL